jgi:uncharacterized protein (UPF0261 family)
MTAVALIGTFDTKGVELDFVRGQLRQRGVTVVAIDAGIMGEPCSQVDITAEAVASAAGTSVDALRRRGDRGEAISAMARGATVVTGQLWKARRLAGAMGIGGSGGSSVATAAMQCLPVGVPKLMVSTIAAGDVSAYVGGSDIAMMYSVLDIAGLNSLTRMVLTNAAGAMVGMIEARGRPLEKERRRGATVAITMFGVTTGGADAARRWLEAAGYEVLVFHANGAGGRTMERLIRDGHVDGVLDLTTTELADEVAGGLLSAGPHRLEAAGELGVPQVVSLGAVEVINFGPPNSVPARFAGRRLVAHNPNVTLVRISVDEAAELGRLLAAKLNRARGRTAIFIPEAGTSTLSVPGGAFFDAEADTALKRELKANLAPAIDVHAEPVSINEPSFAVAMARRLDQYLGQKEIRP